MSNSQEELLFSGKYIKESNSFNLKTTRDVFMLKTDMTCQHSNLMRVVIWSSCNEECTGETKEGTTRLRGRVWVFNPQIFQPNYQKLVCEKRFWTCGNREFKIFPFFKLCSNNKIWESSVKAMHVFLGTL